MRFTEKRNLPENAVEGSSKTPGWLLVILFILPAFIYIPGILGKIPFPSDSTLYNDLLLTHYPNALYLKNTIIGLNQIPLWSEFIHSGTPFAANSLAGIFYLPGWLALLFPLPGGISVTLAMHAVFTAWGMYLFLKSENIGDIGSISGGLIMGLMPKMAAHYGAGHVTLLYAISWTPWLFYVSKKDKEGWKTGNIAALLFLADPRWSIYAGIIWLTYDIAHRQLGSIKASVLYYLKAGITAILIASPLVIPLVEYIGFSTRPGMGVEDIQAFSMSPEKILGLIIPTGGSNPEWYLYSGGTVLGLYFLQLVNRSLRKTNTFWNIWVMISIIIAFGSSFINPDWLVNLPIISLLRVPARSLFLIGFIFAVIAARSIEYIKSKESNSSDILKAAFGIAAAAMGLGVPINILLGKVALQPIWGFLFLFLLALALAMRGSILDGPRLSLIIAALLAFDLIGAGIQSFHIRDKAFFNEEITDIFENDAGNYRIYSPSYSMPQWIAVEHKLKIADGVDPMHLANYSEFMERASGVNVDGYSVTIPVFSSGNPAVDNMGVEPDAFLLSLLNVKYIISEYEIESSEIIELTTIDNSIIYLNRYSSQHAWVEASPRIKGLDHELDNGLVKDLIITPNRIELTARGPGRLVLSEVQYPGWKATIDGEEQEIKTAYGLLRSVYLPAGDHEVVFYFRPLTVYLGLGLLAIGLSVSIWQIIRKNDD